MDTETVIGRAIWRQESCAGVRGAGSGLSVRQCVSGAPERGGWAQEQLALLGTDHDVWEVNVEDEYHEEVRGATPNVGTGRDAPVLPQRS